MKLDSFWGGRSVLYVFPLLLVQSPSMNWKVFTAVGVLAKEDLSGEEVSHCLIIQGVQDISVHAYGEGLNHENAVQDLAVGQAVGDIAEPADKVDPGTFLFDELAGMENLHASFVAGAYRDDYRVEVDIFGW